MLSILQLSGAYFQGFLTGFQFNFNFVYLFFYKLNLNAYRTNQTKVGYFHSPDVSICRNKERMTAQITNLSSNLLFCQSSKYDKPMLLPSLCRKLQFTFIL